MRQNNFTGGDKKHYRCQRKPLRVEMGMKDKDWKYAKFKGNQKQKKSI